MYRYNPAVTPDAQHGEPPVAVINGTKITYSHMTGFVDTPVISGDVPTASGTFDFAGSSLLFHKFSFEIKYLVLSMLSDMLPLAANVSFIVFRSITPLNDSFPLPMVSEIVWEDFLFSSRP